MATLEPDHLGRNGYSYARGEFPNTAEEPGKNTKNIHIEIRSVTTRAFPLGQEPKTLARQLPKSYKTQRIYVKLCGEQYAKTCLEYSPMSPSPVAPLACGRV